MLLMVTMKQTNGLYLFHCFCLNSRNTVLYFKVSLSVITMIGAASSNQGELLILINKESFDLINQELEEI